MKPNKSHLAEVPPAQQKRKARIQPHTALGVAVSCLAAGAFVAYAATGGNFSFAKSSSINSPVPMKSTGAAHASKTIESAGVKAQLFGKTVTAGAKKGGFMLTQASTGGSGLIKANSLVGGGQSGNNLSEVDLTPNTASDERDAVFSPSGEYVAFRSNGIDANGDKRLDATGLSADGKYHIWVGRIQTQSNGTPVLDVYQVTGKSATYLSGYNQSRPSWSPNSSELVFVSNSSNVGATAGEQIYRMDLNLQGTGVPAPLQPYALTSFAGEKRSPVWSLNSTEIVFAAKYSGLSGAAAGNGTFDLFRVGSNGQASLFSRLTGGTSDAGASANDLNPTYSLVQPNVIYFSSNRVAGAGRRIYVIVNNGTNLTQVTDPTLRVAGSNADNDEYPSLSLDNTGNAGSELLAFQSNSLIDASDTTRDRNIWAVPVRSSLLGVVPEAITPRFFVSVYGSPVKDQVLYITPPDTGNTTAATIYQIESGANQMPDPEGALYYQDESGYYLYASARGNNRVERLDAVTGAPRPAPGLTNSAFTPNDLPNTTASGNQVPSPSGLATDGKYLYVSSGKDITNAVYRYNLKTGAPAGITTGTADAPVTTARFTFGEPAADPLGTNSDPSVSEGVAVSKDKTRLYVSNYAKKRVNIYSLEEGLQVLPGDRFNEDGTTIRTFKEGEWLGEIKAPEVLSNVDDPDSTNIPPKKMFLGGTTGVAIGPDIDGDGRDDLYVASSSTHDVLAFSLNADGSSKPLNDGSLFKIIVHDVDAGSKTNLRLPEGIRLDTNGTLYVSGYGGKSINRYTKTGTGAASTWNVAGFSGSPTNASWIEFADQPGSTQVNPLNIMQGPAYFDFNPTFADNYVSFNGNTPADEIVFTGEQVAPIDPDETDHSAYVITNILSSPNNYANSDLSRPVYNANGVAQPVNVTEDKSADIEATFGRGDSGASLQNRVRVLFSSNRKFAPLPSSNFAGATASNPTGGNDGNPGDGDPATNCDLWITAATDISAPVIQPEENNYPMLSPTHESSKYASNPSGDIGPRTTRDGLAAGGVVKLALLANEKGSGLATVSFAFHNAEDTRRFQTDFRGNPINEGYKGFTRREVSPAAWPTVPGFDFSDTNMILDLSQPSTADSYYSDQGPKGTNPERQSNAVAGDGIYYLAKKIATPTTPGDYYISVRMTDRQGNNSEYRFIWGFSTRAFSPSPANDLFVSDNTAGQYVVVQDKDTSFIGDTARYKNLSPVESFYLDNWGSTVSNDTLYTAGTVLDGTRPVTSTPTTLPNVNVWRTLCRGPLYEDLVSNYIPSTVTQINPDKFTNGFQIKDKPFANVQRAVIWASPYAGTAEVEFDIPGSIKDGASKEQLKRLLNGGGRLFLTGRNVLTALDEGGADNSFRSEELFATVSGKATLRNSIAVDPTSGTNAFPEVDTDYTPPLPRAGFSGPQFAWIPSDVKVNDYRDGSYSHGNTNSSAQADTYKAATASTGVQIFQAYQSDGGSPIGQRIIKKRSTSADSGIESRVVFFSFNFDGINRRYAKVGDNAEALDVRKDIADGIRTWFKTGTISGHVYDNTGAIVVNGLVMAQGFTSQGAADVYYARTDATGYYEFTGMPAGRTYGVYFVFNDKTFDNTPDGVDGDANDRDDLPVDDVNRNYFTSENNSGYVYAGQTTTGVDIRVQKVSPGSVTGKVASYSGNSATDNPLDRTLHAPVSGIQVLLTVASNSTLQAPVYTRLTTTTALGTFAFADAPAGRNLLLILNPKPTDVPSNSDLVNPNAVAYNSDYGRRVIPLTGDKRRTGDIKTIQNDTFVVNDTYVYDSTKTSLSAYPNPAVDTKADEKDANGVSLPVVLTRGEPISGKFTLVAGSDSARFGAGWVVKLVPLNGENGGITRQVVTKADGTYTFDEVVNGVYDIIGEVPATSVNDYPSLTAKLSSVNTSALTDIQKAAQNLTAKIAHIAGAVKVNGTYTPGATVTLQKPDGTPVVYGSFPRKGTSGNVSGSANYFIGYVPVGTYKLVAQLPNGGSSLTVSPVVIDANTTVKVVDFNFTASVIKINVATAYPAISKTGATVQALSGSTVVQTGTTDANGDVTFRGLANGNYTFKATNTVLGVAATATSGTVAIVSGNNADVNLTLKWDSLGGVVKLNNVAKSGAKIQFFLNGNELTDLATTSASNGTYEAGKNSGSTIARPLAAGTYTIRASITLNGYSLSKEQTKVIGPTILGQIITLPEFNFKESYLTGVVKFNGAPTSGFQVQLLKADGVTPFTDADGLGRTATTDANGVYRMDSVPIGATGYKIKATKLIGAVTASGIITGPTIVDGATQASPIEINISGGLTGQVRVNGEGAPGAKLEVLDKKKKSLSPAVVVTADANGKYFIIGLPVTTTSVSYVLLASYTENGRALKPLTKSFKVKNGVYSPTSITFDFKVTRVKGLVRSNGSPAVGAAVTLLDKKGAALKEPFTATTDASGNYLLSGVKSGTYRVQASLAGATAYVDVKVGNLKTTVAPTIELTPQELQVTTEFRVGSSTTKIGDAPGATVELLSTAGNSLGTGYTKVTDANSKASFLGLATGSYKARVTLQGYSTTTTFSVGTGLSTRVLPIVLSQTKDLLLISESDKLRTTELGGIDIIRVSLLTKPAQNVQVNLVANLTTEARFSTGNSVSLTFTTSNWNVEQLVTLVGQQDNVVDGNKAFTISGSVVSGDVLYDQIPNFTLSGINFENATIPTTGPTFAANTKTLVSTPFGNVAGKITVAETFGTTGFTLYRFNAAGQKKLFVGAGNVPGADWIAMTGSDTLERGRGYLLVTGAAPVTMLIPANPTIFAGDSFAVDVVRNPNFEAQTGDNNVNNGYDLVGFPFDPSTVSGVDILQQAQVLADGVLYPSFLEAVGAGKISNRIFTVDSQGRPVELTPANSTVKPYRGYFVKIFTDKVKIILKASPSNSSSGSASGSSSGSKSSIKTS